MLPKKSADSRLNVDDFLAGIAAAAVVLPQAMAFGVALFTLLGATPAEGALAGLIGAALMCLTSGIVGATRGLITAPSGPVLILLSGAVAALQGAGLGGSTLLTAVMMILVTTGLFQILLGLTGGGQLIKFIPHPVVAGFLTGSGLLMVISQLGQFQVAASVADWLNLQWLPVAVVGLTFLVMSWVPRLFPAIPSTIAGLVGGTLLFHLLVAVTAVSVPDIWVIGTIPGLESIRFDIDLATLPQLPWVIVLSSALALALLASLDTLFTAVIADVETGQRHRSRVELVAQGGGQLLTGLFGGMGGSGTTGATVVSVTTGGRRWAAVVTAIALTLLIVSGGALGRLLPVSVLAGIIIHVGWRMLERDILVWMRRRRTRQDGVIAVLVTLVTVAYDLMAAIAVGVVIAVAFFIRSEIQAPVIHRRSTAQQRRSVRSRSDAERAILDQQGDRIVLYELRGNLFFGSVDRLFTELEADLDRPVWMILHLRRVAQVDLTGMVILQQIARRLNEHGGQLIFCNVHKAIGMGHQVRKTWRKLAADQQGPTVKTFNGADEALEYAENQLLDQAGMAPVERTESVGLAQSDLCRDMPRPVFESLQQAVRTRKLEKGETLFAAGDFGDALFVVISGEVDIRLPTTKHHYKRLAKYLPGSFFGEIALIEPGARTADAVAVCLTELCELDRVTVDTLKDQGESEVVMCLYDVLARAQGRYLRWSAAELHRLAQW